MSLTRIGSIGINTGIAFAGVTTIVTLNTANDALSIGATVNVGSGITLGASGDIFATGVSTFSGDLKVGSGVTISPDGDIFATGVSTFSGDLKVGSGVTISPDGDIFATGVCTATSFVGDGSGLTGAGPSLTGSTNNTIVTVTGANAIQGESTLTYDGTYLDIGGGVTRFTKQGSYNSLEIGHGQNSNQNAFIDLIGDTTYTDYGTRIIRNGQSGANAQTDILHRGTGSLNLQTSDAASITFETNGSNERVRIDSSGNVNFGDEKAVALPSGTGIQVYNSSTPRIKLVNDTTGNASGDGLQIYMSGSSAIFDQKESAETRFYTAGTERFRIASDGRSFFVGSNSGGFSSNVLPNGNTVNINTKVSTDGLGVTRYSGSYAAYAINIGRSKSDTIGANSIVADGDDLGYITWYGADGTDFNRAASISAQVDGSPSDGDDMPGRLIFSTTADGSGTPTERLRIAADGRVGVGAAPEAKFMVTDISNPDIAMKYTGTSGGHNTRLLFLDKRGVINAQVANNLQNDGVGTAAAHLEFATATGGTLSTAVRIQDDGSVRKLRQPIFGYRGGAGWTTISNGSSDTLALNTAVISSSHYNTSSYRFTAPTDGYYWFGCNLYTKHASMDTSSPHYISGGIRINGTTQTESNTIQHYQNASDGDTGYFISLFHFLNANDYTEIVLTANGDNFQYYGAHCYFYGWLVA